MNSKQAEKVYYKPAMKRPLKKIRHPQAPTPLSVIKQPVASGATDTNGSLDFDPSEIVPEGMLSEDFDEDLEDSGEVFDEISLLAK